MLVLTRKKGEFILIDKGRIKIQFLYRRGERVALGIQAPSHIDVEREEIFLRKQAEIMRKGVPDDSVN